MSSRTTRTAISLCHDVTSIVVIAMLSACAAPSWQSTYGRDHPLTGQIWEVASAKFIDTGNLMTRLASADFVLLGEKHDNPDHHVLQAQVLRGLIAAGRRPAVGFEMFSLDQTDAIAKHLAQAPGDAAGLGPAVNWQKSGWPDWEMYQPIAAAALAAKLPIVATNLPLATARKMNRAGGALEPSVQRHLGLDRPLSDAMLARMAADIRNSHCGYGSAASVKSMVEVQRARDAQMAQSLIAAAGPDGAVLVAGAGHVRSDYGIPVYLMAKAQGRTIVNIAFVEIDKAESKPDKYVPADAEGHAPFDYLWFTPRVDDGDPCEKFKAQFKKFEKAP